MRRTQVSQSVETAFAAALSVHGMKRGESMSKKGVNKTSPLLDEYIQKKNQEAKFEGIEEEEIAKAIRTLLHKESTLPQDLN